MIEKSGVLDLNRTNKTQTQVKKQDDDDYYNCIKVSKERKSKKVILKSQLALQIVKMCIKVMLMCFSVVCFIFVFAPRFNVPLGKISWIGYYSALLTQFFPGFLYIRVCIFMTIVVMYFGIDAAVDVDRFIWNSLKKFLTVFGIG